MLRESLKFDTECNVILRIAFRKHGNSGGAGIPTHAVARAGMPAPPSKLLKRGRTTHTGTGEVLPSEYILFSFCEGENLVSERCGNTVGDILFVVMRV